MIIKWRKSVLRLRSKFIRNAIAMIGVTAMISACGSGTSSDDKVNQDSLDQVKEQERLDSIAQADSIAAADSVALEDTVNADNNVPPVNPLPDDVQTKYGVVPDYYENDEPVTRYGVRYN
ncbi:MAG: hypothetical protein C0592_00350 [Marinilabiliales bacterium]|nr:MAG: hypothetical protein C0592_00350 [Marinilabiliales bacterium]